MAPEIGSSWKRLQSQLPNAREFPIPLSLFSYTVLSSVQMRTTEQWPNRTELAHATTKELIFLAHTQSHEPSKSPQERDHEVDCALEDGVPKSWN